MDRELQSFRHCIAVFLLVLPASGFADKMAVVGSFSSHDAADALAGRLQTLVQEKDLPLRAVAVPVPDTKMIRVGLLPQKDGLDLTGYLSVIRGWGYPEVWMTSVELPPGDDRAESVLSLNNNAVEPSGWQKDSEGTEPCSGTINEVLDCSSGEVKALLGRWVNAWANGDLDAYLDLYVSTGSPVEGLNRAAWEQDRRFSIFPELGAEINLNLETIGMSEAGVIDVVFVQQYRSLGSQEETRKRLVLLKENGEFRIWKEQDLPQAGSQD